MKAHLDSYLAHNPNSTLNIYRDLYITQLEQNVGLELQKFSLDFSTLTPTQKEFFLRELDKAATNINIMRDIVADINKQVEAEQARETYFETVDSEKLKKEKEEQQEKKFFASMIAATEIAALKTSSMDLEPPPSLAAITAVQELGNKFAQDMQAIDAQLIKVTELLLSKVKIVADSDSKLANTGFMDEDGNMAESDVLFNVIQWPENQALIANILGVAPRDVNMLNLKVADGEVVFKGSEDIRMDFPTIADLFKPTQRSHATEMNPFVLSEVAAIRAFNGRGEIARNYSQENQQILSTSQAQGFEWRAAILAERGITVDRSRIDEQMAELKESAPRLFVEQVMREEAAQAILAERAREFETQRRAIENLSIPTKSSLHAELLQSVAKAKAIDKPVSNFKSYMDESEKDLKGKFTKMAKDTKADTKKFTEIVEDSKGASASVPYHPLPKSK